MDVMLRFMEEKDGKLIFRENGETVLVESWGEDSIRVRSCMLGEIQDRNAALLTPEGEAAEVKIRIEEDGTEAELQNGKIKAILKVQAWGKKLQITFLNQKDEILLQEIADGGALTLNARQYKPLPGGTYRLKASFVSDPEEKIYGIDRKSVV